MNEKEIIEALKSQWVMGPVALVLWIALLAITKRYAFSRIRLLARGTQTKFDDILLDSLNFPLNLLILFSGLVLMGKVMPLSDKLDMYVTNSMKVVLILAGVFFIDRVVRNVLIMRSQDSEAAQASEGIIRGMVRVLILVVGTLIILEALGVSITPLIASLGVGSLAVALALRDTLANLFAGIFMVFDKPVSVGQYIRLESGERGYVEDIGLRSTRIRTRRDETIIIPNDRIINSVIYNYSQPEPEFSHRIEVSVGYDSDLEHVERVTMEVAEYIQNNSNGAVPGFKPFMRYHTFGADGICFFVNFRVRGYDTRRGTLHQFMKMLHARYNEEGITIPFPQRTVSLAPDEQALLRRIADRLDDTAAGGAAEKNDNDTD